ncbi:MAG TPA: cytochrome c [Candidatus Angelobacter sp.]|nr:cytochrome c [Candidatus Angelobacter sp.]
MRLKTLGVLLVTAMVAFTAVFWITDGMRRDVIAVEQEEELLHFGEVVYSDNDDEPAAAGCARCHGAEGEGGEIPNDPNGRSAPSLRSAALADKLRVNPNYVHLAVAYGGVVVSGNVNSPMPAWSDEVGGPLNEQQVAAVVALVEHWLEDAEAPTDVEDTVEAGQEVYSAVGCAGCHGAELGGGVGPALTNVGNEVGNLPQPVAQQEQYLADYEEDPYLALGQWIRDSAGNYNDGAPTGMPPHPETAISESALRALITFLLDQTEE